MGAFSAPARAPLYITVVRNRERQTAMAMAARCSNCAEPRRRSRQRHPNYGVRHQRGHERHVDASRRRRFDDGKLQRRGRSRERWAVFFRGDDHDAPGRVGATPRPAQPTPCRTPAPLRLSSSPRFDRRRGDGQQRHRVDDPLGKIVSRRRHRQRVSGFADRLGVRFRLVWRRAAVSGYGGSMLELRGAASPITPATPELWRSPRART